MQSQQLKEYCPNTFHAKYGTFESINGTITKQAYLILYLQTQEWITSN